MKKRMLNLAIKIQQIPSPTFEENVRAQFVLEQFKTFGDVLSDLQVDQTGNVLARLPGLGSAFPLIISAHLDTVFPRGTNLTIHQEDHRLYGPGIGDNSLGVSGLFAILWSLIEGHQKLPGDIWFVANTCEEGLGDLRGIRAVVDKFRDKVRAYLILEGMALGHLYYKAVGVHRYRISLYTQGGHSWTDYGKPSAIHEMGKLITSITSLQLSKNHRTTLNVGRVIGGTSVNAIASEASLELDLRSEDQDELNRLIAQINKLVDIARINCKSVEMESIGQRPSGTISPDHPLIGLATKCLREEGLEPSLTIGSTDANIPLSKGYPAVLLGFTHGGGSHTIHEYIETDPIDQGIGHILQFVNRVWEI